MATYTKPYLSISDQLNLIKQRGLQVASDAEAAECLHRNGYYRLSAYWYPFREIAPGVQPNTFVRTDRFLPDSRFEDAVRLYQFDKKFKLLLLDALERVEIAARVEIALCLGRYDPFAHEQPALFHPSFTTPNASGVSRYDVWISKYREQVRRSNEEFVLHYERRYGSRTPLPIWIAIELWDFGSLSHAFGGMRNADRVAVAARFAVPRWPLMVSWLRTLNYVRNVIAHHGRLWNANLSEIPSLPRAGEMPDFDVLLTLPTVGTRAYSVCCILSHLTRVVNPKSSWIREMRDLMNDFPAMPHADIRDMGFPADWQTHGFWK